MSHVSTSKYKAAHGSHYTAENEGYLMLSYRYNILVSSLYKIVVNYEQIKVKGSFKYYIFRVLQVYVLREFMSKVNSTLNQLVFILFNSTLKETRVKIYLKTFDRPCFYLQQQIYLRILFLFNCNINTILLFMHCSYYYTKKQVSTHILTVSLTACLTCSVALEEHHPDPYQYIDTEDGE